MLSKTPGLWRFKPNGRAIAISHRLLVCLQTSVLALACVAVAEPAFARTEYDGDWSVVIVTRGGACEPTVRYGVQIANGRVVNTSGGAAAVQGRVTPAGAVRVTVQSGNAWAVGSGHLGMGRGGGVWRGQGAIGRCEGTWVAERRGYAGQETSRRVYNLAPGTRAR